MKVYTIAEVNEVLTEIAKKYELEAEKVNYDAFVRVKRNREDFFDVSFRLEVKAKTDEPWTLVAQGGVCRMGNCCEDELLEASEQIRRGALMVKEINEMNLKVKWE